MQFPDTRRRAARLDRWRHRASAAVTTPALAVAALLYGLAGASGGELRALTSLQLAGTLPNWITWLVFGGLVTMLLAAIDAEG